MKSHADYPFQKVGENRKIPLYALIFVLLSVFFAAIAYGIAGDKEILSSNERAWLAKNQSHLVLAVETGYAPFVFLDDKNQPTGLAHDYIRLIEAKLGVHFNQRRFASLDEIFSKVRSGEVHIVNAVTSTPERSKFLSMTAPFISVPNVIIVRKERSRQMSEQELSGLKVSLVKSYAITENLTNRGLHFIPDLVHDDLTALLNVSFGRSDAAVIDLATASYLISEKGIANLRVAGEVAYDIRLSIGTPLDKPVLHGILQKGLDAITDAERQEIKNRWINASKSQSIFKDRQFWQILASVLAVALAILTIILIWNRTLRRQVALRKKIEEELRKYKDHLEEEVQLRTADLMVARDAAEAANKAKSVFLTSMSHELRTPLNAILGFSNLLRKDMQLTLAQRDNLNIINRSGEHLLTLINDVLEMSKIEAGRVQLESAPLDFGDLVHDVTDMMHVRAQEKGLQLLVDQTSEIPRYIKGDEARLRQVLINLLDNAVKFTRQGSVIVRFRLKPHDTQHRLLIEIEDSGIGISGEDQQQLFKPFVQLGKQAGDNKGTGLGLTITRQFVQLMGGKISVESTQGVGSIFRVELPVDQIGAGDVSGLKKVARGEIVGLAPNQPEYRILIVEDQLENQLLLSQLMERIGFSVKLADDGAQGVQLFQSWHPQLIWMDKLMPVMDGLEAAKAIRNLPGGKGVKIVAVTASAVMEQRDEMLDVGMDDFVRKPYRLKELYECLTRQLGVQFIYADAQEVEATPVALTAAMLTVLPPDLRCELNDALVSLDSERIAAVIGKIASLDLTLHRTISRLAENFDYPAILNALQTNPSV